MSRATLKFVIRTYDCVILPAKPMREGTSTWLIFALSICTISKHVHSPPLSINAQNADAGNNTAGGKTTGGNHLVLPIYFKKSCRVSSERIRKHPLLWNIQSNSETYLKYYMNTFCKAFQLYFFHDCCLFNLWADWNTTGRVS